MAEILNRLPGYDFLRDFEFTDKPRAPVIIEANYGYPDVAVITTYSIADYKRPVLGRRNPGDRIPYFVELNFFKKNPYLRHDIYIAGPECIPSDEEETDSFDGRPSILVNSEFKTIQLGGSLVEFHSRPVQSHESIYLEESTDIEYILDTLYRPEERTLPHLRGGFGIVRSMQSRDDIFELIRKVSILSGLQSEDAIKLVSSVKPTLPFDPGLANKEVA